MSTGAHTQGPPKRVFLAAVILIFFSAMSAAQSIGFVPNYIDGSAAPAGEGASAQVDGVRLSELPQLSELYRMEGESSEAPQGVLPERIRSAAIGLDAVIQNPDTRDIDALAVSILKSPTRYVDSAKLGVPGNMLIFGHSSTYRVVRNPMYKVFNRISELKPGDSISVEGGGVEYLYSVTSVRSVDVNEAIIDLSPTAGTKLTLTTCDILTGKSARFVVEADFVGTVAKQS